MAKIAENTVIVDGQEYKPGDVIPDFKSIKCVDTREPRKYQGLSADVSVLNDVIAKYASGGASCFMSDTGEYYEYDRKEKAWKLITNITERGFDSEKAYGALKHMLKNVTVSDEKIQSAVTNYLTVNPVLPGATTEQAQQIEQNRTDVASLKKETGSLKEDLADIATFVKLIDLVKDKPFGYCNGVDDKSFVGNTLSGTFASGNFVEIGAVSDTYLKAGKKYRVAYKTISGSGCVIRTMSDYSFKKLIITVGGAYPLDGFVDVDITTDSNICISNGNGVINCELYVYDITDISEDELSLIDWENPIHNISVGIVSNAIEAEHSKTSDKALVADRVLSVDVNGLVNYSSRNLLDVNNCSVGLLSRGIVGENNGYITSNFMPVNDFVAYCNEGKTDIPIRALVN